MKLGFSASVILSLLWSSWGYDHCADRDLDWLVVTPSSVVNEKISQVTAKFFGLAQKNSHFSQLQTVRVVAYADKTPKPVCAKMVLSATKLSEKKLTDPDTYKTEVIEAYSEAGFDGIVRPLMAEDQKEFRKSRKIILYFYEFASKMSDVGIYETFDEPNDHCSEYNYPSYVNIIEWLPYESVILAIRITNDRDCNDFSKAEQQFDDLQKLGVDIRHLEFNPNDDADLVASKFSQALSCDHVPFISFRCKFIDWTIIYPLSKNSYYWGANVAHSITEVARRNNFRDTWRMAGVSYVNKPMDEFADNSAAHCAKVTSKLEKVGSFDYWSFQPYTIINHDKTQKVSGVDAILRTVLNKNIGRDPKATGIYVFIHDSASHVEGDSKLPAFTDDDFDKLTTGDINYGCSEKDFVSLKDLESYWPKDDNYLLQIRVGDAKISDDSCLISQFRAATNRSMETITIRHDARYTLEEEITRAVLYNVCREY